MAEPKRLNAARALSKPGAPLHPAVAEILEGLAVQDAVPAELLPAIAEVLGYVYQMDDVAAKRQQIQRR